MGTLSGGDGLRVPWGAVGLVGSYIWKSVVTCAIGGLAFD